MLVEMTEVLYGYNKAKCYIFIFQVLIRYYEIFVRIAGYNAESWPLPLSH